MKKHKLIWCAARGLMVIGTFTIWISIGDSMAGKQHGSEERAASGKWTSRSRSEIPSSLVASSHGAADSLLAKLGELQSISDEDFDTYRDKRSEKLVVFVQTVALADIPVILARLRDLQNQRSTIAGHELGMRLLDWWVFQGGAPEAAAWAERMAPAERNDALAAVAVSWAQKAPAAATAWAQQLTEGEGRRVAVKGVVDEQVHRNPKDAIALASTLPQDQERDTYIVRATSTWARRDPAEALGWAKQLPQGELRNQAISVVAMNLASRDLQAAADLAFDLLPSGPSQERAVVGIVQRWAAKDLKGASEWIDQFPEGELKGLATQVMNDTVRRIADHGRH